MTRLERKEEVSPLEVVIDQDGYEYLATNAPDYLKALEKELASGKSIEEIRFLVSSRVGPWREGLVLRIEQAARHIVRNWEER